MASLDSRLWAALAGFTGLTVPQSGGFVSSDQQQAASLGLQLLQQQSNQLYAFPMAQAPAPAVVQPPATGKRPGPPPSSGAARQRKSVMNKKQQMLDLQVKVDAYSQQAREIEATNVLLRQRQSLLNQLVALASVPLQKAEASPACGYVSECDKSVASDVLAVHAAVEVSHQLSVREFLLVSEAYVRAATPLFASDDHRHMSVLSCLTTAYRQVVELWEMHHLQEAYEMRHMNLGAFIVTGSAVFLDQDDPHWADVCASTHAREGLVSWARAEVERQRQGDLQCIVELCKEGLGRRLSGVMVTLLLDLLARRCLPVRSLAALWIESWPYRSNPVHMFKAPAVVFRPPGFVSALPIPVASAPMPPAPASGAPAESAAPSAAPTAEPAPAAPMAAPASVAPAAEPPAVLPASSQPPITPAPAATAAVSVTMPALLVPLPAYSAPVPALSAPLPAFSEPALAQVPPASTLLPEAPQLAASAPPMAPPREGTAMDIDVTASTAPAAPGAAAALMPEAAAALAAAAAAAGVAAAIPEALAAALAAGMLPEGVALDPQTGKLVPAGKPKKKGVQRDTESLAAQALMMMAGK